MVKPRRPKESARQRLATNIRAMRKERGISQEELAAIAGLHRTYVGAIERGERNVSIDNVERLAQALTADVIELLASPSAKTGQ